MRSRLGLIEAAVVTLVITGAAQACDCAVPGVAEARRGADAVFAGTIKRITSAGRSDGYGPPVIVEFDVRRVWKGLVGPRFVMHSYIETTACEGFWSDHLKLGEMLLVYARARIGADRTARYSTSICTRTRPVRQAADDLTALGPGAEPLREWADDRRHWPPIGALPAGDAAGWECRPLEPGEARTRADVVLSGRVSRIRHIDGGDTPEPRAVVEFEVERVWKGPVTRGFTLHSFRGGDMGLRDGDLKLGERLLVYAVRQTAWLWKQGGVRHARRNSSPVRIPELELTKPPEVAGMRDESILYYAYRCLGTKNMREASGDVAGLGPAFEPMPWWWPW